MGKRNKKIIKIIQRIEEDINTLDLNDRDGWKHLYADLENVMRDIPKGIPQLHGILTLCMDGVTCISERSVTDFLALIDALSEALIAGEQYLLNNPDCEALMKKAGDDLEKALARGQGTGNEDVRSGPSVPSPDFFNPQPAAEGPLNLSLNDVAAFLIQLEPDDYAGLARLREMVSTIAAVESWDESVLGIIKQALQNIDRIIEESSSHRDETLAEVGKLIEEAMNAREENRSAEGVRTSTPVVSKQVSELISNEEDLDAMEKDTPEETTKPSANSIKQEAVKADKNGQGNYMPEGFDPELIEEYITESNDLISNAEEALLTLETDPENMEAVNTVFRAFHTIKGSSAFLELTIVSEIAHHAETLLSRVRDGEIQYSGGYAELSLRSIDTLKELIQSVQYALHGKRLLKPEGYDDLMELLENPEEAGISEEFDHVLETAPRIGDILVAQGKAERQDIEDAAVKQSNKPIGAELVQSQALSVNDVAQALRTQQRMRGIEKTVDSSVRVRTDRLDRLIDMVGEVVIAHSMVAQDATIVDSNNHELLKKTAHTSKIVRELQDLSMSMRMVPLKSTFRKMARLIRDLANKSGKKISLVTEGDDTEIDRNMVDLINDPLMHMVRNAADHGIGLPEEREKQGKPPTGTIKLSAYHSAGNVVVEIKDDGRGIDREAIFAKAQERGLVTDGGSLSDREILNLIFEPGFSTAQLVTEVSGRGVGMDVVKRNIEELRGQIEVQSEVGKGCTFQIRLPLTLAIIDGMLIRVGRERYIIPTVSIVRSIKPKRDEISTVLNAGEMLSLGGSLVPLLRLSDIYNIDDAVGDPTQAIAVVVDDNGNKTGLLADELLGQQQIVIKALGETMKDVPGVSGGAIIGDGQVSLILDIGGLVRLRNEDHGGRVREKNKIGNAKMVSEH